MILSSTLLTQMCMLSLPLNKVVFILLDCGTAPGREVTSCGNKKQAMVISITEKHCKYSSYNYTIYW